MSLSGPASPRAVEPNRITRRGWKYATTRSSNAAGTSGTDREYPLPTSAKERLYQSVE